MNSTLKRNWNRKDESRRRGNAVILALLLLSMLAALATAQFAVVHKNLRSSSYFSDYSDLHECAESGIAMAMQDLRYELSGNAGKIGTVAWTPANDLGGDGASGTFDGGGRDGIPTAGEPNVAPVSMGPPQLGARLLVHVSDTAWLDVQRIVATASNGNASATVSTYVKKTVLTIPKVAAVYVDPTVALDLKGNAFII